MPFISYAQNFEDIILWRALGHIQNGFYVDVGANDPEVDSVTKAFYDRGWCGINVEPVPKWFDKLKANRNRDINLNVAAGNVDGSLALFEIPNTGLSTLSREIAQRHKHESGYEFIERLVPVTRLTDIIAAHHSGPIHFLKIDVEGAEREVLQGLDLDKLRPWIILVEATLPNLPTGNHDAWEPILLAGRYEFAYFDGMNRFYVASERSELKKAFDRPPNVFDDFVCDSEVNALRQLELLQEGRRSLEREMLEAKDRVRQLDIELRQAETRVNQASTELQRIYLSRSWRLTRPLRWLAARYRHARRLPALLLHSKYGMRFAKAGLRLGLAIVAGRPTIHRFSVSIARKLGFYSTLRRMRSSLSEQPRSAGTNAALNDLAPTARRIFLCLRTEIKRRQSEIR